MDTKNENKKRVCNVVGHNGDSVYIDFQQPKGGNNGD